jgi:fucose permease
MTKQQKIGLWFAGASAIFFTRAFLFSTWVSRGPEVQQALEINTAQMGLLSMIYPAGGLAGVLFANRLVHRFGSRTINTATFALATAGFAALGPAIEGGNIAISAICLFLMGMPMAISDYVGNYEGSGVDKASKRSLFPAIHGSFGVGMLLGASFASWLIDQNISLSTSFISVAIFVAIISLLASFTFSGRAEQASTSGSATTNESKSQNVWLEKRSLILSVLGFSFIMAEMSAGTWVPIALTKNGFSGAEAASAFGVFWIVITIARLLGGFVVDFVGRYRTVLLSALVTAIGMVIFITSPATGLHYLGLILWGAGMALGFPMVVASMSDDPAKSAARVNMIITVVYISSISVGPALGALGQAAGVYVAFGIPLAMMVITAIFSGVTKPNKTEA